MTHTHLDGTVADNGASVQSYGISTRTLTYLVDLLLREILEVGVGGHDGGNSIGLFIGKAPWHTVRINSAMTHNTDSGVVVQSMRMSNNAMRGNT